MFSNLTRGMWALVPITTVAVATTAYAQSPAGTWVLSPPQASSYAVTVQQPVNADGTSNFKNTGKAVIPIKFSLSVGRGPAIFQSIGSDADTANDFSFLSFTPSAAFPFGQLATLVSNYLFTEGDCHGGSLRWSVRTSATQSLFIYYGNPPQFGNGGVNGCTGANSQTGQDLLDFADLRFDTSQYVGGTFYDTYAHALQLIGANTPIIRASLVLDSGWGGDQVLTLGGATVNTNTFTPLPESGNAPTCNLPPAEIQIEKTVGNPTGIVNEPISVQPPASDDSFRIVDCKYMYNLATSSLSGPGHYSVTVLINGTTLAVGSAEFDIRP